MPERTNAHLSQTLTEFVNRVANETELYKAPSEYMLDLIRRDTEMDV